MSNKRDVFIGFRSMIECATGRSAFDFLGYAIRCPPGNKIRPLVISCHD